MERKLFIREMILERSITDQPQSEGDYLHGYAIVFNTKTRATVNDYGAPAYEVIAKGAFTASIAKRNVKFTFNHLDPAEYADTDSKTLTLSEDDKGHTFRAAIPTYATHLRSKISSGDVKGMSFGFVPTDVETLKDGTKVVKKGELYHISPVYVPYYSQTTVAMSNTNQAKRQLRDCYLQFLNNSGIDIPVSKTTEGK